MSDYTKGPWSVDSEDSGDAIVTSESRPFVATVHFGAIPGMTEANARLIAAAPELLEVLQLLASPSMSSVRGNGESSIGWQAGELSADQRLAVARAAIAKATGARE